MALSADELKLLREIICQGQFNGMQQLREGFAKLPLTPQILESIRAKSDEEIRATFVLYKAQKAAELAKRRTQLQADIDKIETEIGKG